MYLPTGPLIYLLQPIVWVILLVVGAIFMKNRAKRNTLLVTALVCLCFFSNKFIVGKVFNAYEADYPKDQHYDIGIVLGGFSSYTKDKGIVFNTSGDRFFQAIYLYNEKKIDKIMISGGSANVFADTVKEADLAAEQLRKIGIPDTCIIVENQSRNTAENAAFSYKKIMAVNPDAKIVVITSAWHIPRARKLFAKYFKREITFYPSNYIGKTIYNPTDYYQPSYGAFTDWQFILKEWAGLVVATFN